MSKGATIALKDIPAEVRAKMNLRTPRKTTFPRDDVRRYAFRALAVLADLKPSERARVLAHAVKLNAI